MGRTVLVGATVLLVVVLAAPATRRRLSSGLDTLRERAAAFREDYATREAQLRAQLAPDEAAVAAAVRHRADS